MQHVAKKRPRKRRGGRRLLLCAALGIALAAGFALAALRLQSARPPLAAPSSPYALRTLESREPAALEGVSMLPAGSAPYELLMRDGHLRLVRDGELCAIDTEYESDLLDVLTIISVEGTVAEDAQEVADALPDMGLTPPRASAILRYTDGTQATLELGGAVPHTGYAYMRWSGDPGVHLCNTGVVDALSLSAQHLLPVEKLQVEPSLVDTLLLKNAYGESLFRFHGGASGELAQPYAYPLSHEGSAALLTALQNLRLGIFQEPLTAENRAAYGLDTPLCTLTIVQKGGVVNIIRDDGSLGTAEREPCQLTLAIGQVQDEYFYTCEYQDECYLVSRFLVETLITARRESFLTRNPASVDMDSLLRAELRTQTASFTVEVERSEQVLANNAIATDANGDVLWNTQIRVNGLTAAPERLEAFLTQLNALTAAADAPEGFTPPADAAPRWTLVLETRDGATRTLEGYRMDAFSDALALNGVIRHTVHADALEALLTAL